MKRMIRVAAGLIMVIAAMQLTMLAFAEQLVTITGVEDKSSILLENLKTVTVTSTLQNTKSVSLYDNGRLIDSDNCEPYEFDISALVRGMHKLTAIAENDSGEKATAEKNISVYTEEYIARTSYDFENYTGGGAPHDFAVNERAGYVGSKKVDDAHKNSFVLGIDSTYSDKVSAGKSGGAFADRNIGYDSYRLEMDVYLSTVGYTEEVVLVGSSNQTIAQFNKKEFKIRSATGSLAGTIKGLEAKKWYRLILDIDLTNHLYTATLLNEDSSVKGQLSSKLNTALDKNAKIRIYGITAQEECFMAIDNYSVKELSRGTMITGVGTGGAVSENGEINSYAESFDLFFNNAIDMNEMKNAEIKLFAGEDTLDIKIVELSADGKVITVTPKDRLVAERQYAVLASADIGEKKIETAAGFYTYKGKSSIKIEEIAKTLEVEKFSKLKVDVLASGVEKIELYDNGVLYAEITQKPYEFDMSKAPLGKHKYKAVLTEPDGETVSDEMEILLTKNADTRIASYTFDDYINGRPGSFGGWEQLGYYRGVEVDKEYGTSIAIGIDETFADKLASGEKNSAFLNHEIGTEKFRIEYDFRIDALGGGYSIEMNQSGSNQGIVTFDSNGISVKNMSGEIVETISDFELEKWYTLVITADTQAHKFSVLLKNKDGSNVSDVIEAELRSGINKNVSYRIYGPKTADIATMYIDNYSIYSVNMLPYIYAFGNNMNVASNNVVEVAQNFDIIMSAEVSEKYITKENIKLYSENKEVEIKTVELLEGKYIRVTPVSKLRSLTDYTVILSDSLRDGNNVEIGRCNTGLFTTGENSIEFVNVRAVGKTLTAEIHNNTDSEKSFYIIVNSYNDEKLAGSRVLPIKVITGISNMNRDISEYIIGDSVEIYIWDNLVSPESLIKEKITINAN